MIGPSFDSSVVDLNPVPIGILKIHLPNTVRSDRNLSQCARKILKCDPTACQLAKGLVEARRRKRKVGGSRPARWNVCCAEDQMDGPSRAEPEPADVGACALFLDLRKPEDLRIEPGAYVQVAYEQRDMVQIERVRPYHESVWGMSHSVQSGGRGIIR